MPILVTDQGLVHYEVIGRGRPVILVHGWLGSTALWRDSLIYLRKYYRVYALDLWGFGESGTETYSYSVKDFVKMIDLFMETLGISQSPIVGHSMGGTVSLWVAIEYPHRVSKVVVAGSPIVGSSLAWTLKLAGLRPIAVTLFNMMWAFRLGLRIASPMISRNPRFWDMLVSDLSKTTVESFLRSISSLHKVDLRPMLDEIRVPVLGIYGDQDNIVHPLQWQPMQDGIPNAVVERFAKAGHMMMLDEPNEFNRKLKSFLDGETPTT